MKIIKDDKVYVQNIDLTFLLDAVSCFNISVPNDVMSKIYVPMFICDGSNQYEFKMFEGKDSVEFFKKLDYIVDYDELKNLSDDEIMSYGEKVCEERNSKAHKYNNLPQRENDEVFRKLHTEIILLEHKLSSVRDMLWFKEGHIKMTLPEGIEYPEGYKAKKDSILRRIFKRK